MSHKVDKTINHLLDNAEARRSCLVLDKQQPKSIRRALSRRKRTGSVTSPVRGVFVKTERWKALDPRERSLRLMRALQEMHPTWVFCGPSAAVAHGLDVSFELLEKVHVAVAHGAKPHGGGIIQFHDTRLTEDEDAPVEVGGLRVTPLPRTVFDCLRKTDFHLALGIADSALRTELTTKGGLTDYFERQPSSVRGKQRAIRTLSWADQRSENGGESQARARMIQLRFAVPELQVTVPGPLGEGDIRADYIWLRADGRVIIGEIDGMRKYWLPEYMGGRELAEVASDQLIRDSRISLYDVTCLHFKLSDTEDAAEFGSLLDSYGVPRRGSELELPDGTPFEIDWERLRRTGVQGGA